MAREQDRHGAGLDHRGACRCASQSPRCGCAATCSDSTSTTAWLPDDNIKGNFDNNAAALQVAEFRRSMRARGAPSRSRRSAARRRPRDDDVWRRRQHGDLVAAQGEPGTGRQQHHVEGMPFGTRSGFSVERNFGRRRIRAHDRRHGARARCRGWSSGHGHRAVRRQEFYRTNIGGDADHKAIDQTLDPAVGRSTAGCGRSVPRHAGQHKLAITFVHPATPEATSASARSRSRAARSASRPRMRCRFAGRCRSTA